MHKSATKCNETLSKWCKNKHGASKIMDTFETYQLPHLEMLLTPSKYDDIMVKDEVVEDKLRDGDEHEDKECGY
jgi:hypothetical protein